MPTFFAFNDGKLQRELSVRTTCASVPATNEVGSDFCCFSDGVQFSGADEALLRDNINQLNEL